MSETRTKAVVADGDLFSSYPVVPKGEALKNLLMASINIVGFTDNY